MSGGDVAEAAGVAIGEFADGLELGWGELSAWEADAEHEVALVGFLLIDAEPAEADFDVGAFGFIGDDGVEVT